MLMSQYTVGSQFNSLSFVVWMCFLYTKSTQVGECVCWKDLVELILVLMIKLHKFSMV